MWVPRIPKSTVSSPPKGYYTTKTSNTSRNANHLAPQTDRNNSNLTPRKQIVGSYVPLNISTTSGCFGCLDKVDIARSELLKEKSLIEKELSELEDTTYRLNFFYPLCSNLLRLLLHSQLKFLHEGKKILNEIPEIVVSNVPPTSLSSATGNLLSWIQKSQEIFQIFELTTS